MAYCRNAYAVFDGQRGKMTEFAVFDPVDSSSLSESECALCAAVFLQDRQNIRPADVSVLYTGEGICFVRCPHRGGTALVGVREDSGTVCLFVRAWKE